MPGAVLTVLLARPGGYTVAQAAALALPLAVFYAFLGLSAWYPSRSLPLKSTKAAILVASHGAAALVTSAAWVLLGAGLSRLLDLAPSLAGIADGFTAQVPTLFVVGVLLYLLSVALHYVLLAFEAAREAERREADLRLLAREAELKALKSQVQPHFLFNCLNSIPRLAVLDLRARGRCAWASRASCRRSLAVGEKTANPRRARSRSLREATWTSSGSASATGSLVEEAIEPSGEECLVPPLLLQPLVENAVVHGISTLAQGGEVRLEARRTGNRLRIVIENPFDPDAPLRPSGGLGLKIVRDRLTALYGSDAIFAARRLEGRHLAVISIPARALVSGYEAVG